MYFPVGWPKYLALPQKDPSPLQFLVSSCDRMLFAVITENSVAIWFCKPSIQIVCVTECSETVDELGVYCKAEWKPNSSMIAVSTSKGYMVFFMVELDLTVKNHHCIYVEQDTSPKRIRHDSNNYIDINSIPAVMLTRSFHVHMSDTIKSLICIREDLLVATSDGQLHRLRWDGTVNPQGSLCMNDISLSADFQFSRASRLNHQGNYIEQIEYSPLLGGHSIVFGDGTAAFVIPTSSKSENHHTIGVWAKDLSDAGCVAVNHKYRLIAFGCKNGQGVVYCIDEVAGALEISHRLVISSKEYPDAGRVAGPVQCMKWTPDGAALIMTWKYGGFSLWSVFGALLFCTLGSDYWFPKDGPSLYPPPIISMEWGLEGYHLWVICKDRDCRDEKNDQKTANDHCPNRTKLLQFNFVKSALTINPSMTNHEHLFLQGEDKLYVNTGDTILRPRRTSSDPQGLSTDNPACILIGNKQWQVISIHSSYLATNWPIKYTAIDRSGQCVAVAGKSGLAHYTLFNRRWKLFGNETQEKDLMVSGGLTWWKDFICCSCYNLLAKRDEIRCYPRNTKLDNNFASITRVPSQVLLLNTFRDILILFCADCHIMLYNMERTNTQSNTSLNLEKIQEVSLNNFIPHPLSITGVTLTSLRTEPVGVKTTHSTKEAESILLNVAGKLLMFQRDHSASQNSQHRGNQRPLPFCSPAVVATSVENVWTSSRSHNGKTQLMEALWLGCGAHGMKVWLPLVPKGGDKDHNFMSRRIMLPFRVDIYPLAILFEDAVILGADSDAHCYSVTAPTQRMPMQGQPFCTLERTSQIYLHHILRQLLRRNLGVHALDIARCCTELPYFSHVLELLLHEVLETEATSKEPIPDPLLPRVVAFIQEFPEYLETVVHCARKTEVALWPHLFSTVGNPKDLFEECLDSSQLNTAASYLIILQNLMKPLISRQYATRLLVCSLEKKCWELARDIVRFLRAIDPSELESPPPGLPLSRATPASSYHTTSQQQDPPPSAFSFTSVARARSASVTMSDGHKDVTPKKVKEPVKHTLSDAQLRVRKRHPSGKQKEDSADQMYIDVILCRHARKLLAAHSMRDLGFFAANMENFQLVSWLRKERLRAGRVEDFVSALQLTHQQFQWPLPILSFSTYQYLKKNCTSSKSSMSSQSSLHLLETMNGLSMDASIPLHQNGTMPDLMPPLINPPLLDSMATSTTMSDDVILRPQPVKDDGSTATVEISDSSSLVGDQDGLGDQTFMTSELQITHELEMLSQEVANKGPPQAELELRYMLQILLEAECLEWAMILSVILRDALAVIRTVNTASWTDTPLEMVGRLREGLSFLQLWANTECFGYKPFLHTIRPQIQVLNALAEQTPASPQMQMNNTSAQEINSLEEKEIAPAPQIIRSDSEDKKELPDNVNEEKSSECIIS